MKRLRSSSGSSSVRLDSKGYEDRKRFHSDHERVMLHRLGSLRPVGWNVATLRALGKFRRSVERVRSNGVGIIRGESDPPSSSKARGQQESSLLHQRLSHLGLAELAMKADGNCQFRSISYELFGTQECHKQVRDQAVAYLLRHADQFQLLFDGKRDFERYMRRMKRVGAWGDELTLRAIANEFGVTVHVLTSTTGFGGWYLKYEPESEEESYSREALRSHVFLTYVSPVHYNVMTCRLARDQEMAGAAIRWMMACC